MWCRQGAKQLAKPVEVDSVVDIALQRVEPHADDRAVELARGELAPNAGQDGGRIAARTVDGQVEERPRRYRVARDKAGIAGTGSEVDLKHCLVAFEVGEVQPLKRAGVQGVDLRCLIAMQMAEGDVIELGLGEQRRVELRRLGLSMGRARHIGNARVEDEHVRGGIRSQVEAVDLLPQLLGIGPMGDGVDEDRADRDRARLAPHGMDSEVLEDLEDAAARQIARGLVVAGDHDSRDPGIAQPPEPIQRLGQCAGGGPRGVEQVARVEDGIDVALDSEVDRTVPRLVDVALALVEPADGVRTHADLMEAEVGVGEVDDLHRRM